MTIDIIINEEKTLKDNILITGFHGIGTTGFIAVKYIATELGAEKIGTILSDYQPPFVTTAEKKISLPFELFQKDKIVLLVPQFQPYRHEYKAFSERLVEWSLKSKIRKTIMIGGLDSRLKKKSEINDRIRIIATTAYLEKYDTTLPFLEDGLFVTGPLALMLTFYEVKRFPAIALLPYAESSRADPLAASIAVEEINHLADLNVSIDKLIQDAEKIEQDLSEIILQTKEQQENETKELGNRRLYI